MAQGYLDRLDAALAAGCGLLGERFKRRHAAFVRSRQKPDGGFPDRAGGSDVYYTDFALRTLTLLAPEPATLAKTAAYLRSLAPEAGDLVEHFNRLNCARMLARFGLEVPTGTAPRLLRGTPYDAFLGFLCCEIQGRAIPRLRNVIAAVSARRCPDGGFSGATGPATSQTNATAAAAAFLKAQEALDAPEQAVHFLVSMQSTEGGFLAHASAPEPDLLSTFAALVALFDLGALDRARLADAGRFVRSLALFGGGFRSAPSDVGTDVEFAYYGVGTAALLRGYASGVLPGE